jgi:hypothetical protein
MLLSKVLGFVMVRVQDTVSRVLLLLLARLI